MVQSNLDFFRNKSKTYERPIFTLHFQEQNQPFNPLSVSPFLGTLEIQAEAISMRQSCF